MNSSVSWGPECACFWLRAEKALSHSLCFFLFLPLHRESFSHAHSCKPSSLISRAKRIGKHIIVSIWNAPGACRTLDHTKIEIITTEKDIVIIISLLVLTTKNKHNSSFEGQRTKFLDGRRKPILMARVLE